MVNGSAEAPQLSAAAEPVPAAPALNKHSVQNVRLRPVCFDGATILLLFTGSPVQSSPAADGETLTCPKPKD